MLFLDEWAYLCVVGLLFLYGEKSGCDLRKVKKTQQNVYIHTHTHRYIRTHSLIHTHSLLYRNTHTHTP